MRNLNVTYTATFNGTWNRPWILDVEKQLVRCESVNSPRVDGKLVLRTNAFSLYRVSQFAACNNYTYRYVDHVDDTGIIYGWNDNPSTVFEFQSEVNVFPQDVIDECLNRFLRQASSLQANLAVMYAERTKTANMVINAMKSIAAAGALLRKGRFQQAARKLGIDKSDKPLRDLSEQWLQLQYGWRPLLNDVYAICTAKPPISRTASSSFTRQETSPVVTGQSDPFGWSMSRDVTYRCAMRGTVRVSNSAVAAGSAFGLTDPNSVAWELVPFSFVVDWFLPVGDYLARLHALDGLELFDECTTYAITNNCKTSFYRSLTYLNPSVGSVSGGTGTYLSYRKTRYGFIPKPVPLPAPKNPFSLLHLTNAFALLFTAFRR